MNARRPSLSTQENLRDAGAPSSARAEGWAAAPGGRTIDDYRLGPTLGQGHFATVKLAQRQTTGKMVALKIIELNAAAPRQQEMIYRELMAMQQVTD